MNDETLRTAFHNWEVLSATQEEALAYEVRLKHILDAEATIREAELREQEALKRGMERGIQEGIKEGIEQGIKEGIKEGEKQENQAIARRLLEKGIDLNTITEITGMDSEQITKIKNKMEDL